MKWPLLIVVLVVIYLVNESVERDRQAEDAELRSKLLRFTDPRL